MIFNSISIRMGNICAGVIEKEEDGWLWLIF